MEIKRIVAGALSSNGYVIYEKGHKMCYIIDPGYNAKAFLDIMEEEGLELKAILLTHYHYDHVGAVEDLVKSTGCSVYLHSRDSELYDFSVIAMKEGYVFSLSHDELKVIHTPGHTGGSVCLVSELSKKAFSGDTIFNVDLGRTDLAEGNPEEMKQSISQKINLWPDQMTIYPGHGDHCTMEYVRQVNTEFLDIVGKKLK